MGAVVISAGSIENYDYIKSFIKPGDFVICADGGLRHAKNMGVTPDLTVGDFDSWTGELTGEVRRFKPEKDYTDTHIAVSEALSRGFKEIILLGCSGTRLDHTMSNIGLLEYIAHNGAAGRMIDEHNDITVITKAAELDGEKGGYVSIIPIGEVHGVTIENLKYEISDRTLRFEESLTVSNEFIGKKAKISLEIGSLIVIKSRD